MQDKIIFYAKFGKYEAFQTEKCLAGYTTKPQFKNYFQNVKVLVYFRNIEKDECKIIEIPLLELYRLEIVFGSNMYRIVRDRGNSELSAWLFKLLKKQGIEIVEYPQLKIDREFSPNPPKYYLYSVIGDKNIKITTKPTEHIIKSIKDRDWLRQNGFYDSIMDWKNKKL